MAWKRGRKVGSYYRADKGLTRERIINHYEVLKKDWCEVPEIVHAFRDSWADDMLAGETFRCLSDTPWKDLKLGWQTSHWMWYYEGMTVGNFYLLPSDLLRWARPPNVYSYKWLIEDNLGKPHKVKTSHPNSSMNNLAFRGVMKKARRRGISVARVTLERVERLR